MEAFLPPPYPSRAVAAFAAAVASVVFALLSSILGHPSEEKGWPSSIPSLPPNTEALLDSSIASTVTVVRRGCGVVFLQGQAFDMCPEAPHDQQ